MKQCNKHFTLAEKEPGNSNRSVIIKSNCIAALQRGADSLDSSSNPLMFFCDVDLAFTKDFLNQCRAYSSPGIYYLNNPTNL